MAIPASIKTMHADQSIPLHDLLRLEAAAAVAGRSLSTIKRWIADGSLTMHVVLGRQVVARRDLEVLLAVRAESRR